MCKVKNQLQADKLTISSFVSQMYIPSLRTSLSQVFSLSQGRQYLMATELHAVVTLRTGS